MEETTLLEILNRIKSLIKQGHIYEAKEYLQVEINNLTGASIEQCKNTKYHFYSTYCKYCSNINCKEKLNNQDIN